MNHHIHLYLIRKMILNKMRIIMKKMKMIFKMIQSNNSLIIKMIHKRSRLHKKIKTPMKLILKIIRMNNPNKMTIPLKLKLTQMNKLKSHLAKTIQTNKNFLLIMMIPLIYKLHLSQKEIEEF